MDSPVPIPELLRLEGNLNENMKTFREEIGEYFAANKIWNEPREVQVAVLLDLVDDDVLRLYCDLDISRNEDATVYEILDAIEQNYKPKKNNILEIFHFINRFQFPRETFDEYLEDLRARVARCEFGDQEERMLTVQIIRGMVDKNVKFELLVKERTLDEVINYCRDLEIAKEADKLGLGVKKKEKTKYVLVKDGKRKLLKKCKKCDEIHPNLQCPAATMKCEICDKKGHLAKCCTKKQEYLEDDEEAAESLDCLGILGIQPQDVELMAEIEAIFARMRERKPTKNSSTENPNLDQLGINETNMCKICLQNPQNGLIIHSRSSHTYGCYGCAKKIFRNGVNCPQCSKKIWKVSKLAHPTEDTQSND